MESNNTLNKMSVVMRFVFQLQEFWKKENPMPVYGTKTFTQKGALAPEFS